MIFLKTLIEIFDIVKFIDRVEFLIDSKKLFNKIVALILLLINLMRNTNKSFCILV